MTSPRSSMGLFSKFFTRENEAPEEQVPREPPVAPPNGHQVTTAREAAAERANPTEPRAGATTGQVEATQAPTSTEKSKAIEPPPPAVAPVAQPSASAFAQGTDGREGNVVFETDAPTTRLARSAVTPDPVAPPPVAPPAPSQVTMATSMATAARAGVATAAATKTAAKPNRPPARVVPSRTATLTAMPAATAAPPTSATASAPRAQPAPARKVAPTTRAAEPSGGSRRTPKDTPRLFSAPVVGAPARTAEPPLAAEVDAALDDLLAPGAPVQRPSAAEEAADRRAVAATFAEMAKVHAHPLREFMFQLSLGRTPRQWAPAARPVVAPLLAASQQIGLPELATALAAFDAALERAALEPSACIGDAASAALQEAYRQLNQHMPEAFAAIAQGDNRRLILLESLLLQVPALHRRMLGKLYAAGLSSLAQLSQARPDELAAVTGIDRALAQRVVEHIQRFERERSGIDPSALRSHIGERLRTVIDRLTQLQTDFERAEQEENGAAKRAARRGRDAAVLELEVLLAEVGDLPLIEELKRCPVRGKIKRVESYLREQRASA